MIATSNKIESIKLVPEVQLVYPI